MAHMTVYHVVSSMLLTAATGTAPTGSVGYRYRVEVLTVMLNPQLRPA